MINYTIIFIIIIKLIFHDFWQLRLSRKFIDRLIFLFFCLWNKGDRSFRTLTEQACIAFRDMHDRWVYADLEAERKRERKRNRSRKCEEEKMMKGRGKKKKATKEVGEGEKVCRWKSLHYNDDIQQAVKGRWWVGNVGGRTSPKRRRDSRRICVWYHITKHRIKSNQIILHFFTLFDIISYQYQYQLIPSPMRFYTVSRLCDIALKIPPLILDIFFL